MRLATRPTPYLGPQFDERKVLAAVEEARLAARRSKDAAREAADMIADGNIVGWFQGRMEFGPRALGNRSLLADPRRPDNVSEPIVCTPAHAIATFRKAGIDALFMGDICLTSQI
jgi:predicted NodU family carbamoyl transferase